MSDPSSRILLLSEFYEPALSFVGSVTNKDISLTASAVSQIIPWTISNKYYTAEVHFQTLALPANAEDIELPSDTPNVPAVLFVWSHGQPYREHATHISSLLRDGSCEPEVCLAIRLPPIAPVAATQAIEEDSLIDDFLSSLGFEFISTYVDEEDPSDIPGLPRALDALSTIIWPSMKPSTRPPGNRARNSGDMSIDQARRELSLHFDEDAHKRDLDELARWLDEPEPSSSHNDPWSNATSSSTVLVSPTDTLSPDNLRFDDDFTAFISAPPAPRREATDDTSDFGESTGNHSVRMSEFGELASDDEDEDLPSEQEIQTSSARIFSSAGDEGNFDLSTVLSALEGMKVEIASIGDEEARRRAAATAALGLVYGLENQKEKEK